MSKLTLLIESYSMRVLRQKPHRLSTHGLCKLLIRGFHTVCDFRMRTSVSRILAFVFEAKCLILSHFSMCFCLPVFK